jgi:hypothetical protein
LLKKEANFHYLSQLLESDQTVPHIFKFLILINRLLLEG